ncbi:MAG TPA: hypothetical protein VJN18_02015 [Polyangiaceae bacterium]|nr:hypothetical protein [Polyangiaceae bacterium]
MTTDDLTHLFEAERAVRPPPGELERGLGRLLGDVARGAAPLPVAATTLKLGLSLASKWLAVGFAVGLGGAGAASQIWAPNAAAAPSTTPARALVATEPLGDQPVVDVPRAVTAPAPPRAASAARVVERSASSTSSAEPATAAARLEEELRLIAAAKRELELGQAQLASAWLTEHAARFPAGVFATDREGLGVLLRCGQHKDPRLAQRFAATHPSSPIVERLLRACSAETAAAPSVVDFSESRQMIRADSGNERTGSVTERGWETR